MTIASAPHLVVHCRGEPAGGGIVGGGPMTYVTVRAHADFAAVIALAYESTDVVDERAWAERIAAGVGSLFEGVIETGTTTLQHDAGYQNVRPLLATGCACEITDDVVQRFGRNDFERFMDLGGIVSTHAEIMPFLSQSGRDALQAAHRRSDLGDAPRIVDAVGLVVRPQQDISFVVLVRTSGTVQLRARQRMRLLQLGLHLQNALRLRRSPDAIRTLISHSGQIVHRTEDGKPPRMRRVWRSLLTGNVSVVPGSLDGVPCYGLLENEPTARCFRALSAAEHRVVHHASRGLSNKMLGYALGLSPSSISRLLESAALKLGFGSRAKLVRIASTLSGGEASAPTQSLTPAEADVLELVRAGLSNRAIADARGRSERTIANQVASLLRKTGSQNRRRLIAGAFHSTKYPSVIPPKIEVAST